MEKIIFLDIDGVIATPKTIRNGMFYLTPECEDNLKHIIENTCAKIVLISSWRYNTLEVTKDYMDSMGFNLTPHIIGITIRAYQYLDKTQKIHLSIPRGVEIKQWIDTHLTYPWYAYPERHKEWEILNEDGSFKIMKHQEVGKDFNYVILDDDTDMLLEHKDYFIWCNPDNGLEFGEACQAIEILNNIKT